MPEPLEGIKVVELARALQGPVAGQYLADMGAEVIKIEPALGDANRRARSVGDARPEHDFGSQFVSANRGKRSLWLDLRAEPSLEIVRRLVDRADVFMSNYLEPSLIAMGLGYEVLRERNPNLIYALVNGYGPQGPDAAKRMLDGAAAARGGLYNVTGPADGGPMMPGSTIADTAGAMQFALGITTALAARALHGGSQRVDTSAFGAQLWLQMWEIDHQSITGHKLHRAGPYHANIPGTTGLFETADGGAIFLAFLVDEESWVGFCRFAGLEDLILDERFDTPAKRAGRAPNDAMGTIANEIRPYLERAFREKTTAQWRGFFETVPQVVWDVVQNYEQVLSDPQALANGYIVEQGIPTGGTRPLVGNVVQINGQRPVYPPPPALGADNEALLSSLGYDAGEIQAMTARARAARTERLAGI
ncbi:MAG: CoA transferase [Chloroflexi bacterium]|nr:CoA transferase [Chloroflexota bacterium]MDA1147860.1 CoA transferase [Chloroflexota bacterium]